MLTLLIALVILVACVKVRWFLDRPTRRDSHHAAGTVELTKLWNEGASFDLPIPRKVVTALSVLGLGLLWRERKCAPAAAGLALGGGLSNLLERLRTGRVYDYLRFPKAPGKLKRYVYNLADLAVFLGGIGLVLSAFQKKK